MAQGFTETQSTTASPEAPITHHAVGERRLRQIGCWLLLASSIQGSVGLAWDIQWHTSVGRDTFWTPPHLLIYSGVALGGLIALTVVLWDTWRFHHQREGTGADVTTQVFRVFHAPLGFIVSGFGALTLLLAAPFDNYWHELYGIDVTLWAPFHMMGLIGSLIMMIGLTYAFAAEAAILRQAAAGVRRFWGLTALEWGALTTIASILLQISVSGQPALALYPTLNVGPISVLTFPLMLGSATVLGQLAAVRLTQVPSAAVLVGVLMLVRSISTAIFASWAVRTAATLQGLPYLTGRPPLINPVNAFLPLFFVLTGIFIAQATTSQQRAGQALLEDPQRNRQLGMVVTLPILIASPLLVRGITRLISTAGVVPPGITIGHAPGIVPILLAIPVTLALGALLAGFATALGDLWRWNTR